MKRKLSHSDGKAASDAPTSKLENRLSVISWIIAGTMVVALIATVIWRPGTVLSSNTTISDLPQGATLVGADANAPLPTFIEDTNVDAVVRLLNPHTVIPTHTRDTVDSYIVQQGDSVFGIAKDYKLKPETVLWANYDILNDDPQMLSVGVPLKIPPVDGIYYKWQEGDTLENVAAKYHAKVDDILTYSGNKLDMTDPEIEPGAYIMIPGGYRETVQWVVPTIARGKAGVNKTIPGACDTSAGGAYGTGSFIWPSTNHYLSGNDYWSGHLAIDIAAGLGAPVYASDSGVVVYAGAIGGGYGNMIMIDHGNGYQTLYAHLSSIRVSCGSSVYQGNLIGLAGSTGNSTGPHLHFEVRYFGGFINPWQVLP